MALCAAPPPLTKATVSHKRICPATWAPYRIAPRPPPPRPATRLPFVCVAFAHRRIVQPVPLGVGPVLFLSAVRQQHRPMPPTRGPYPDAHGAVPIDQMGACRLGSFSSTASAWESGRRPAGEGAAVFLGAVGRVVLRTEAFYEAGEGHGTGNEAGEGRRTGDEAGEGRGTRGGAGEGRGTRGGAGEGE